MRQPSLNEGFLRNSFAQQVNDEEKSLLSPSGPSNNLNIACDDEAAGNVKEEEGTCQKYGSFSGTASCVSGPIDANSAAVSQQFSTAAYEAGPVEPSQNLRSPRRKRSSSIMEERELLQDEMRGMTQLALPVVATYFLEMLPGIVTIVLVGNIRQEHDDHDETNASMKKKLYMDAAAIAVMFVNFVGMSTGMGLLSAMDTLCSQAYGANQTSKMGTYFLTGSFLMCIVTALVSIAIRKASSMLTALGQPSNVASEAAIFAWYLLPGIPFVYAYELIRKMSQARNEAMPMVIAGLASNIINCVLGYYLVYHTHWGWLGAALARTICNISLVPVVLVGMLCCGKYQDGRAFLELVWQGCILKESINFSAIHQFLTLGVPGMLQLIFEWWAFEAIALLCGLLPEEDNEDVIAIGANAVVLNIFSMTYMLYLGVSAAGNVRIGNALGAGDPHRAKMSSFLVLGIGSVMSIINTILLLTYRTKLPLLFTTDKDISLKAQQVLLVCAFLQFPDALNGSVQGIFRGSGRQSLAATLNFVAYYFVGLPLGYGIGIKMGFGVEGLWWGMTVGLFAVSIVGTWIVLWSNWNQLSYEARKRVTGK